MRAAILPLLARSLLLGGLLLVAVPTRPQAQASPDELRLANGAVVRGQCLSFDRENVVFRTGDGVRTYPRAEVRALLLNLDGAPPGTGTPATPPAAGGGNTPPATGGGNPPAGPAEPPAVRPVPTDPPAVVDAGVEAVVQALRARDVEAAARLCYPTERARLRELFAAHREQLPRVADLLATRELVVTTGAYAEYRVTDRGNTYPVIFERCDGVWCLSQL